MSPLRPADADGYHAAMTHRRSRTLAKWTSWIVLGGSVVVLVVLLVVVVVSR
jgi:hypothetical protein